jgi:hypothetical protein
MFFGNKKMPFPFPFSLHLCHVCGSAQCP